MNYNYTTLLHISNTKLAWWKIINITLAKYPNHSKVGNVFWLDIWKNFTQIPQKPICRQCITNWNANQCSLLKLAHCDVIILFARVNWSVRGQVRNGLLTHLKQGVEPLTSREVVCTRGNFPLVPHCNRGVWAMHIC
jgi:hypothetical protein